MIHNCVLCLHYKVLEVLQLLILKLLRSNSELVTWTWIQLWLAITLIPLWRDFSYAAPKKLHDQVENWLLSSCSQYDCSTEVMVGHLSKLSIPATSFRHRCSQYVVRVSCYMVCFSYMLVGKENNCSEETDSECCKPRDRFLLKP